MPWDRGGDVRPSFGRDLLVDGHGLLVTDKRLLWIAVGEPAALPFDAIRAYVEVHRSHRYALVLEHDPVEQVEWAPAHRFLWWSWGNDPAVRRPNRTILVFSRRDALAATAMRERLSRRGVVVRPPIVIDKPPVGGAEATLRRSSNLWDRPRLLVAILFVVVVVAIVLFVLWQGPVLGGGRID